MPENPLPLSLIALNLALPALWLLGRAIARVATRDGFLQQLLAPGLALGAWLLCVHVAGLATRSYVLALWIGTLVPAAVGLIVWARDRRRIAHPRPLVGPRPSRWMWAAALVVTGGVALPLALSGAWHDEMSPFGHFSTV